MRWSERGYEWHNVNIADDMASYSGRDLSLLPSFNFTFVEHVEHYIKTNKFSSGNKSINKGFKFYSEGYIHDLKGKIVLIHV